MRKKFKQEEVEKLIAGIREAYETKIRRLEYRNEGLVSENRTLRASLAEMKNRESKVGKALVAAETKGEEIKEFYRMSAETEWKTLRLFADKWKKLAAQMAGVIPKDDAEKYTKFADDLAALLGKEQGKFRAEERLCARRGAVRPRRRSSASILRARKRTRVSISTTCSTPRVSSISKNCAAVSD